MRRVDAKKEIDQLFSDLSDVVHFVGTAKVQNGRGETRHVAFARLVFAEDHELRPWPKKLIFNHALEAVTGVQMFAIYEPGQFLEPFLTTEWEPSCGVFMETTKELGMFMIEIITPKKKRSAIVVDGEVRNTAEKAITPEDYEFLSNAYIPPATAASS
jgi:hypothetical protein